VSASTQNREFRLDNRQPGKADKDSRTPPAWMMLRSPLDFIWQDSGVLTGSLRLYKVAA
jgi:hypothetical protein